MTASPLASSVTFAGGGDGFALTTAVGTDVDVFEPSALDARTRTRSVSPTSADVTTRVFPFAPMIAEQLPPFTSQRSHAYVKLVGEPDHVPGSAVKVSPSCAAPEIVGGGILPGAAADAGPTPTTSKSAIPSMS